jgi:hypothetical protein
VVERGGLENRYGPLGHRGFESHPLRLKNYELIDDKFSNRLKYVTWDDFIKRYLWSDLLY